MKRGEVTDELRRGDVVERKEMHGLDMMHSGGPQTASPANPMMASGGKGVFWATRKSSGS